MAEQPAGPTARFDRYLVDDELLVFAVHRHPAILLRPLGMFLASFAVMLTLIVVLPRGLSLVAEIGVWVTGGFGIYLAWQVFERSREFFVVTDRRLMLVGGLIRTTVGMMPLGKVTDLRYERSLPGHLFRYGRFVLESAGQDQALSEVDYVAQPDAAYRVVVALVFGLVPDPDDIDHVVRGDWRRVGPVQRSRRDGGSRPAGEPEPTAHHRPATETEAGTAGTGGTGGTAGPDGRPDSYSRAISIAPASGRAETLFRSADLQARQRSADTGPVPRAQPDDPFADG